jgi:hypothetical protein
MADFIDGGSKRASGIAASGSSTFGAQSPLICEINIIFVELGE